MEGLKLAIIADSNFENIFDKITTKAGYKNAQLGKKNCAFLSAKNSFQNNLKIMKKLQINMVIELTNTKINNDILTNNEGIEYFGVVVKENSERVYIKNIINCFINEKQQCSNEELTSREKEVLGLIAKGYSNKEIAKDLFVSEKTVKNHVSNIFKKINVADRTNAAIYAINNLS